MASDSGTYKNSTLSKTFFILSIVVFIFWISGQAIDVYRFAIVGTIYEFLWLLMLFILFVLPIISLILLIKGGFNLRSLYLYTIIIAVTNILLMILIK